MLRQPRYILHLLVDVDKADRFDRKLETVRLICRTVDCEDFEIILRKKIHSCLEYGDGAVSKGAFASKTCQTGIKRKDNKDKD